MSCPSCSSTPALTIYACSGAADVGEIADRTARALVREGHGKMSCAVGVAAGIQNLRNTALSAAKVLAIDGCATRCVARAMQEAGVRDYTHIELGESGFPKGASPASEANLERALGVARFRLDG